MLTSWDIIKSVYTEGVVVETMGFYRRVFFASNLFCKLLDKIVDRDLAEKAHNDDPDVEIALPYAKIFLTSRKEKVTL